MFGSCLDLAPKRKLASHKRLLHNLGMDLSPVQRAVLIAGSQSELARALGISYQAVQSWIRRDRIPPYQVLSVEKALQGEISAYDLDPTLYPRKRFRDAS